MLRTFLSKILFLFVTIMQVSLFSSIANEKIEIVLNEQNQQILESFFKVLLKETTAGYVFLGEKPVGFDSFSNLNCLNEFPMEITFHSDPSIVGMKEGFRVWQEVTQSFPQQNIIIHLDESPKSIKNHDIALYFINRKAFIQTVQENISLFKYILGPQITPESLLSTLIQPQSSFYSVIKNNYALAGILLGYGTHNSIAHHRTELVDDWLEQTEKPPLISRRCYLDESKSPLSLKTFYPKQGKFPVDKIEPSFGFSTLREEYHHLLSSLEEEDFLRNFSPRIIFGRFKDNKEENAKLVERYTVCCKRIEEILASPNLLEELLSNLGYTLKKEPNKKSIDEEVLEGDYSDLLAKYFYIHLFPESDHFISFFIQGMEDAANDNKDNRPGEYTGYYKVTEAILKAKEKIAETDTFFNELSNDLNYQKIVKNKLYYRILKKGTGPKIDSKNLSLILSYSIALPSSEIVAFGKNEEIFLPDTISGFAHGLQEMQIGEKREILIHPDFAYGIFSNFERGIYLKAIVELQDILPSNSTRSLLPLVSIDVPFLKEIGAATLQLKEEQEANSAWECGYYSWKAYMNDHALYSLEKVIKKIKKYQKESPKIALSAVDIKILEKIHWLNSHSPEAFN